MAAVANAQVFSGHHGYSSRQSNQRVQLTCLSVGCTLVAEFADLWRVTGEKVLIREAKGKRPLIKPQQFINWHTERSRQPVQGPQRQILVPGLDPLVIAIPKTICFGPQAQRF